MKRQDRSARVRLDRIKRPAPVGLDVFDAVLDVAEIGARGDGTAAGPTYVPFSLPGEKISARVAGERAEILNILHPSPDRIAPACKHFGKCGGCQLQHWSDAPYLAWKREQVIRAMAKRGLHHPVEEIVVAWGEGRRRAALHAGQGGKFGFIARGGAGIIAIEQCPVLAPQLANALPALKAIGAQFAPAKGEIVMACLATDTGIDLDIKGGGAIDAFNRSQFEAAAAAAEKADLARLSFAGETLVSRRTPVVSMGLARVAPPPSAFLQPTAQGESVLAALTLEALDGCTRVVDLFSGIGTFALRLAKNAEVHAVEGEMTMLNALKKAADGAGGALKAVSVERRDLLRTPLAALELKKFDGAAFDPPRSGARLQAEQIAASRVSRVAAVSCDPATFARDARVLIDAGFELTRVVPVDQFRWSPHVEIVGMFAR